MSSGTQEIVCGCDNTGSEFAKMKIYRPEEFACIADSRRVFEFARFLAEKSPGSNIILIDDIKSLDSDISYSKDDIVVIRDGIVSLVRFPEMIETLKKTCGRVQKVLLSDDIHSFPDSQTAEAFLERHEIPVELFGYVNSFGRKIETLAVISNNRPSVSIKPPADFRVIAVMCVFNEEDIIKPVVEHLRRNGVDLYLMDNWSTDSTYQKAQSLLGKGIIGLERFPADGPSEIFQFKDILKRKEELCQELKADWFIHYDADEIHESPWPGLGLRDAMYWVDQQGCNSIDFTLLKFFPVDDNYQAETSFADHIRHFEFPKQNVRSRAWKATKEKVAISENAGHFADLPDRKVYPYKFLLRHYPLRSQNHAEKKVLRERKPRFSPLLRKQGWHVQYDIYNAGSNFLKNAKALIEFNSDFYTDYLIERLSGIGMFTAEELRIKSLENELTRQSQSMQMLSAQLQATSERMASLTESITWRVALGLRKIRMAIAPPNSRSAAILRRFKKIIWG